MYLDPISRKVKALPPGTHELTFPLGILTVGDFVTPSFCLQYRANGVIKTFIEDNECHVVVVKGRDEVTHLSPVELFLERERKRYGLSPKTDIKNNNDSTSDRP